MKKEKGDEIIGRRVKIKSCEAREHGRNPGCVCDLIGRMVTISKKYDSPFVGTASYHIKGSSKRVRRSEVILPRKRAKPIRLKKKVLKPNTEEIFD